MERPKIFSRKKDAPANFDLLKQELQKMESSEEPSFAVTAPTALPPENNPAFSRTKTGTAPQTKEAKPRGRKKKQTEALHRLTIDLPISLFQAVEQDADANYTTIRGCILSILNAHYNPQ